MNRMGESANHDRFIHDTIDGSARRAGLGTTQLVKTQ